MKLIACPKCNDTMQLVQGYVRTCFCGECGGKYLSDRITAVVNKDAIVFGIDNNGFGVAKQLYEMHQETPHRIDFFFTGWIPNHPGEVIQVETVEDVLAYEYEMDDEDKEYDSTWPSQIAEQNEYKKLSGDDFFDFQEPDNRSWLQIIRDLF